MRLLKLGQLTAFGFGVLFVGASACTSEEDLGSRPDGGAPADGGLASDGMADSSPAINDGAPAADAPMDAPPGDGGWTPKDLPGLELWLDDKVGIVPNPANAGSVRRWLDQSGKGHNATAEIGGGDEPSLDPAALNGLDVIRCVNQTAMTVDDAPGFHFGTGDFGIVVVAQYTASAASNALLYQKTDVVLDLSGSQQLRLSISGTGGGFVALANIAPSTFHILSARGSQLQLRGGGNVANGPKSTADLQSNAFLRICGSNNVSSLGMAEMLVVKGTLSDADLAKTEAYLKAKFGL